MFRDSGRHCRHVAFVPRSVRQRRPRTAALVRQGHQLLGPVGEATISGRTLAEVRRYKSRALSGPDLRARAGRKVGNHRGLPPAGRPSPSQGRLILVVVPSVIPRPRPLFAVEESWLGACTGFHINPVGRPVLVKRDCSTWNKATPSEEDTAERFLVEHLIGKRGACDATSPVPLRRATHATLFRACLRLEPNRGYAAPSPGSCRINPGLMSALPRSPGPADPRRGSEK